MFSAKVADVRGKSLNVGAIVNQKPNRVTPDNLNRPYVVEIAPCREGLCAVLPFDQYKRWHFNHGSLAA
jgi:hypothetical protein